MAKGKRGFKFTTGELEALAEAVEELVPISTTEWERVWDQHITRYPDQQRTLESLKRKFQELARAKIKTGDPNMPRHIRVAKRAYYAIVKKTDGSTGGGSNDSIFGVRSDDEVGEEDEEEGGGAHGSDYDDDRVEVDEIVVDNHDGGVGGDTIPPTNLFGDVAFFGDDAPGGVNAEPAVVGRRVEVSSTDSAVASSVSRSAGGKRSSDESRGGGAKQRKTKAFAQPLRIPRKSPSNASDDGEESGWSFGNMMHMMMMQSRRDNERREQQYKIEREQREREYQLRREELAIARDEAREQRQLTNRLFMSMLNKNGGSNSNPPPSPASNNNI